MKDKRSMVDKRPYYNETLDNARAYVRLLFIEPLWFDEPYLPVAVDKSPDVFAALHTLYARIPDKIFNKLRFEL